ncbi:MAG: hypothetical protein IPJ71_08225 [Bdellovibrionales bacterium]|nr:hypothetical protein [Bdellovibrionales bacterium]
MGWFNFLCFPSILFLTFGLLGLAGCGHSPIQNGRVIDPVDESEYAATINKYTRSDRQYSGFYQSYELAGTLITSETSQAILKKRGTYLQWDAKALSSEREKALQALSSQTTFLFSLYTPERTHNDLNKGTSIWKIYLDADGTRYEGKVKKRNEKLVDIIHLFPYHSRWSIAYRVDFDVPTSVIERSSKVKIVFTSSLGASTFEFNPK